ncbi:MAG: hypothetical protein Q7S27_05170 [Nanoarchaeota archaeon]|nr:hypothetical protein [Nanoarchaeota archaeon]
MMPMSQQKERIISIIKMKGPSLPVQVAKGIGVVPLFAGAFLSELYAEKRIKISNMRVGSSPLYYIEGQEGMLENFIEHLNVKEREAFLVLKKAGILDESLLTPVIRVALREIRDFAIPVKIILKDEEKVFWRYHLLDEIGARAQMQGIINPLSIVHERVKGVGREDKGEANAVKSELELEVKPLKIEAEEKITAPLIEINNKISELDEVKDNSKNILEGNGDEIKKHARKIVIKENEFPLRVKKYLNGKDIEVFESLLDKKKEFMGKIRTESLFGKQEYFLVAKDKKNVTDNDLAVALQTAQSAKMPVLVVSSGELNKKAQEYLREWRNLIRFEKLR